MEKRIVREKIDAIIEERKKLIEEIEATISQEIFDICGVEMEPTSEYTGLVVFTDLCHNVEVVFSSETYRFKYARFCGFKRPVAYDKIETYYRIQNPL